MRCRTGSTQSSCSEPACKMWFVWDPDGCYIACGPTAHLNCVVWSGVPWLESRPRRSRTAKKSSNGPAAMDVSTCAEQVSTHSAGESTPTTPMSSSSGSKISLSRLSGMMHRHLQLDSKYIPQGTSVKSSVASVNPQLVQLQHSASSQAKSGSGAKSALSLLDE